MGAGFFTIDETHDLFCATDNTKDPKQSKFNQMAEEQEGNHMISAWICNLVYEDTANGSDCTKRESVSEIRSEIRCDKVIQLYGFRVRKPNMRTCVSHIIWVS